MDAEFERFCRNYEGRGRVSNQRYRKMSRMHPQYWASINDPVLPGDVEEHFYLEILFTQEGLGRLLARERQHDDLLRRHDSIQDILKEQLEEDRIRHANPAVDKAYQRYLMLLRLVKDNYR